MDCQIVALHTVQKSPPNPLVSPPQPLPDTDNFIGRSKVLIFKLGPKISMLCRPRVLKSELPETTASGRFDEENSVATDSAKQLVGL